MAQPLTRRLAQVLDWLIQPHRRVVRAEKIARSRLLSLLLLILLLFGLVIIGLVLSADATDINEPTVRGAIVLLGIVAVMYVVNRLGFTTFAAIGIILPFVALFIYIPFYSGENPLFLAFILIPIVLTAIFFPLRWTAVISLAIVGLVFAYLNTLDRVPNSAPFWNLRNVWFLLFLMVGLLLTFMWHLGTLEQIRQAELARINSQLEQKVAELERFAYVISHELRAPVVTLTGFLGSIEKDLREGRIEPARTDLQRVASAAERMNETLADLVELSRLGVVANSAEAVALGDVVREAVAASEDRRGGGRVTVRVAPDLPVVMADRGRLAEAFDNLLDNALKYPGQQAALQIEIGVRRQGRETVIYVRDNGLGIEAPYLTRIFGLFEKLDPASEGTGVGLALVKRIIEVHGGRIWAESEGLNRGSAFCFTLPIVSSKPPGAE